MPWGFVVWGCHRSDDHPLPVLCDWGHGWRLQRIAWANLKHPQTSSGPLLARLSITYWTCYSLSISAVALGMQLRLQS